MIKVIQTFLIVFALFYFGIDAVCHMTGCEKWKLTKLVMYSLMCAALTTATLALIVITF